MRHFAIGDIHGCSRSLDALLALMAPSENDRIITLGDYVNRGPDSCGVLNRLVKLHAAGKLIALRGNHEEIMMDAREGGEKLENFLGVGGRKTLSSYRASTLEQIPDAHWDFIENVCRDWYEINTHFFVHANAYPDVSLEDQPGYILKWESFDNPSPHESGKIMVCGHSSQKNGKPRNIGHAICIDTHAHGGGWLTGLETGSGRIFQANERGEVRQGWASDYLDD